MKDLLKASQQRAKVGGWRWTMEDQRMFWTNETYRIHEIDPSGFGNDANQHIELSRNCYDEADRPLVMAAFQKCVDKGISYDMELPFTTLKGKRKPPGQNRKTIR